jgi:hypothetical protein
MCLSNSWLVIGLPLFTRLPTRWEPVEKVGVELIATTNRARNAPKPACLVPDLGRKRVPREFFNSLMASRNSWLASNPSDGDVRAAKDRLPDVYPAGN